MNPLFQTEYILIIFGGIAVLGTYLSWRSSANAPKGVRITLTVLRFAALLVLAVIAFDPGYWKIRREDSISEWAVMIDKSTSMKTDDVDGPRIDAAKNAAAELAEKSVSGIAVYPFYRYTGNAVKPANFAEIKADGNATDIAGAGMSLLKKYNNSAKNLKGIFIISDGRATVKNTGAEFPLFARAKNIPLYGICLGGNVPSRNLELKTGHRSFTLFKDQSQKISLKVINRNLGRITTAVSLTDSSGKLVTSRKVMLDNNSEQTVEFRISPGGKGFHEYIISAPPVEGENIDTDNSVNLSFTVIDENLNVLMIEGRPFWDSKFLSQVLRNNKYVDLTAVYRLSPDRFFLVSEKDAGERESKKVIFPETLEKLAAYNLVIFGKGAEFFLDDTKITLLKKYVRDFGGALLFARGKPYAGEWRGFSGLEPAYWGDSISGEFRWTPTDAGVTYGLFGEMLPAPDSPVWQDPPPVGRAYRCPELRSFTEVLMNGKSMNSNTVIPVLLKRKIGKGIVLAVNSEGLWQWDFFPEKGDAGQFYRKFWTQLVFWAVKYSDFLPNRDYSLRLSRNSAAPGDEIIVFVNSRKKITRNLNPTIKITADGRMIREIVPAAAASGRGWNAVFSLNKPGRYQVSLNMPGSKMRDIFSVLEIKPPPREDDELSADPAYLDSIVKASGGKLLTLKEALEIVSEPDSIQAEQTDADKKWHSAWNIWWLLVLLLALFGTECYLRRRNGML